MKMRIEEKNTAQKTYNCEKQLKVKFKGRTYKRIGKSWESRSTGWRFLQLIKLVAILGVGVLFICIPFSHSSYRKKIKQISSEINRGQEKIVHITPVISDGKKIAKEFFKSSLGSIETQFLKAQKRQKNIEITAKISIGSNPKVHVFRLDSKENVFLEEEAIKEYFENINAALNSEIEGIPGLYEGGVLLTLFKDQNDELHLEYIYDERTTRTHGGGSGSFDGNLQIQSGYPHIRERFDLPPSTLLARV